MYSLNFIAFKSKFSFIYFDSKQIKINEGDKYIVIYDFRFNIVFSVVNRNLIHSRILDSKIKTICTLS